MEMWRWAATFTSHCFLTVDASWPAASGSHHLNFPAMIDPCSVCLSPFPLEQSLSVCSIRENRKATKTSVTKYLAMGNLKEGFVSTYISRSYNPSWRGVSAEVQEASHTVCSTGSRGRWMLTINSLLHFYSAQDPSLWVSGNTFTEIVNQIDLKD